MASYITVLLDTTAPVLEIFAPRYTNQDIYNEITIEANEAIENIEIYILDSHNVRRDYVFEKISNNTYRGRIKFKEYPIGISTIYIFATDDVGNVSNIYSHSIEVKDSITGLSLEISDRSTMTEIKEKTVLIELKDETSIKIDTQQKEI